MSVWICRSTSHSVCLNLSSIFPSPFDLSSRVWCLSKWYQLLLKLSKPEASSSPSFSLSSFISPLTSNHRVLLIFTSQILKMSFFPLPLPALRAGWYLLPPRFQLKPLSGFLSLQCWMTLHTLAGETLQNHTLLRYPLPNWKEPSWFGPY